MIVRIIMAILIAAACVIMYTHIVNNMPDRYKWPLKVKKCVLSTIYVLMAVAVMCWITLGIKSMV